MTVPNPLTPSIRPDLGGAGSRRGDRRLFILAGIILGASQAGFFDGIVLHQLLQWHHMFSSVKSDATVAGMELNTLGDGLFHLLNWVLNITGVTLLWLALRRDDATYSTLLFVGALILGFGLFNLTEGVIDHHLLQIHHVKAGPHQTLYDVGFLVINTLVVGLGGFVMRVSTRKLS